MNKALYDYCKITDIKDMLKKSGEKYAKKIAFKIRANKPNEYITITHEEVRKEVDGLGTSLINLGLKDKRIAVIGENRYEWEIAYLSVVAGTGTIVPLDKSLPEHELERLIRRSEVEAIFYPNKYEEILRKIVKKTDNKLKHLISMDLEKGVDGIFSQKELIEKGKKLIENGDRSFIDAKIDPEEMNIMLFTSGTTSESKAVALCQRNIVENLMGIASVLDISCEDRMLSFLPIHHVFECTVGFMLSLYMGMCTSFCDGVRHIVQNMQEYKTTFLVCVPAIYENIYRNIIKNLEKQGKMEDIKKTLELTKNSSMEEKKQAFKEIHEILGGKVRMLVSGAAALSPDVEQGYRDFGFDLFQGYGLTETSPVVCITTSAKHKLGSIGPALPNVEIKIDSPNKEGIGELLVKGPNVMMGYYGNKEATNEVLTKDGWFYTGDLCRIDEEGYVYISGRKKSVIVLKNGKNIFPEEMEHLVNKIEGVKESFIYGNSSDDDQKISKIFVEVVYDKEIMKDAYKAETEEEIYKAIKEQIKLVNQDMPMYKSIKGVVITEEPIARTTTGKIKRYEEMKKIEKNNCKV